MVDDDPVARRFAEDAVRVLGHECLSAEDGETAWAAYRRERPDVVLSDWVMPGVDGLELCRRIRAEETVLYSCFILVTSLGDKQHALQGMLAGADDYLTKPLDPAELQMRLIAASRIQDLHRKLQDRHRSLESANRTLNHTARIDALTGLGNRLMLDEELNAIGSRLDRYGNRYCIGVLDLDRFKQYNDSYGHLEGDEALKAVAATIAAHTRGGDSAYRFGGEEFVCILRRTNVLEAAAALERIRDRIQQLAIPHEHNPPWNVLTVSAGVAQLDRDSKLSPQELLGRADEALYRAKEGGRNQVCTADSEPRQKELRPGVTGSL